MVVSGTVNVQLWFVKVPGTLFPSKTGSGDDTLHLYRPSLARRPSSLSCAVSQHLVPRSHMFRSENAANTSRISQLLIWTSHLLPNQSALPLWTSEELATKALLQSTTPIAWCVNSTLQCRISISARSTTITPHPAGTPARIPPSPHFSRWSVTRGNFANLSGAGAESVSLLLLRGSGILEVPRQKIASPAGWFVRMSHSLNCHWPPKICRHDSRWTVHERSEMRQGPTPMVPHTIEIDPCRRVLGVPMRWQGTSMYSGSAQTRKLMSPSPHDPPHPSARRLAARE
mmetsp:Transcript_55854/g.130877  ORF Transcript_55854/g.130877 Transcript_55854/m.130877 type:complete len:286 (-) Transcript_55854:3-860(-)